MKYFYAILLIALLSACTTGQKDLNKGNYYDATIKAVQHLRSKPNSEKSLSTLQKSYPMSLSYYRQKIEQYSRSGSVNKYLDIANTYSLLNNLADEISRSPAAVNAVGQVVYFHDQQAKAEIMAANEQYKLGESLLNSNDLNDARDAYARFQKVKSLNPNYPRIDEVLEVAKDKGTLKIVVESIPVNSRSVGLTANEFFQQTYSGLQRRAGGEFIHFYTPDEAEKGHIAPHHVIRMQFNDFVVGNVYDKEVERQYTADSVVVGTLDGRSVYGKVKAKAYQYTREVVSNGSLNVQIIDYATDKVLSSKNFPGQYVWRNTWARYNGDERALPEEVKQMSRRKQQLPPSNQDLFVLFTQPIYENSTSFIANYYKRKY